MSADEIVEMARKKYISPTLTRVDDHTVACLSGGITYIPIPPGSSLNNPGLLTIDLPEGVKRGQSFKIVVRQFTSTAQQIFGGVPAAPQGVANAVAPGASSVIEWKQIRGTFQISIPVTTRTAMLGPEERLLSILRWILKSIPHSDRWYPVFRRYVDEIADRVDGLGGNSDDIKPSPTGDGRPDVKACERIRWLIPLLLAPVLVLIAIAPLIWSAPIAAIVAVLIIAAVCYFYLRCKPSLCSLLGLFILGIVVAQLIIGAIVLYGYRTPSAFLMLALLAVLSGLLFIITMFRGCCWRCTDRKPTGPR